MASLSAQLGVKRERANSPPHVERTLCYSFSKDSDLEPQQMDMWRQHRHRN